ncbi:MAG: nucleotidyltransferase family protein [Gemmatimonadaceae bacterium]|nr:nucleotidyltransferase family protein [Gemmatimonadaceae bacterium]
MLSAEARLVFRSADLSASSASILGDGAAVTDWERALRMAEREGATGTLWRALAGENSRLPAGAKEFLRARTMLGDFRMRQLASRLAATLPAFRERGVAVMLLKGAAIGALADPTFRLRPMTDVDLLVRDEDVLRAHEALVASGWRPREDPRLTALLHGHQHLPPYDDPQLPGLRVELHTRLLPADHGFHLEDAALWGSAVPAAAPFEGALVPSLHDLLFHTCVHFAWQHQLCFGPWRTFRAVSAICRQPDFDWATLSKAMHVRRGASAVHWTLRLASLMSGVAVPESTLRALAPPTPDWLCAIVERWAIAQLAPGEFPLSPSVRVSEWLWRAAIRPRWSGHGAPHRLEESQRWSRTLVNDEEVALLTQAGRHVREYRSWWAFLQRTVAGN